jgi:predicted DNA-binding transcriptional regulator
VLQKADIIRSIELGLVMKDVGQRARAPDIKGNTLRVYLYLLQHSPADLRDVQRSLSLSTPSLASYHLAKLLEGGYATQNEHGQYVVVSESANDILEGYVKLGAAVIPQLAFFAVLFTALVCYFALMSLSHPEFVPLLIVSSVAMVVVLWYETLRVWRRLATWK